MQKKKKETNVSSGLTLFDNPKQLLTVKQAASSLGVSIHRVYRWIYHGQLVARRLPGDRGGIRLVAGDVESLLRIAYPDAGKVPHF